MTTQNSIKDIYVIYIQVFQVLWVEYVLSLTNNSRNSKQIYMGMSFYSSKQTDQSAIKQCLRSVRTYPESKILTFAGDHIEGQIDW